MKLSRKQIRNAKALVGHQTWIVPTEFLIHEEESRDPLAFWKGLIYAVPIGLGLWAVIIGIGYLIYLAIRG